MKITLLIDIGSTFTKMTAVDLEKEEVVGRSHAPSTVTTDMTRGLLEAYERLLAQIGRDSIEIEIKLACSSAAGGLRIMAVGLVASLTTEAARRAALGSGAKVVGVYSHRLTMRELREIEEAAPDILLLAGGTDGGNTEVILENSKTLGGARLKCPVVICGNKVAADEVTSNLLASGKHAEIVENVLPDLDRLNIEPCRSVIREIFIKRIVHGKGLDKAQSFLGGILMPTPLAVLDAALLIAQGTSKEEGLGDLIVVDIGGATTDVVSIADGKPTEASVILKGLPETYAKRTVEGDLGIRYNAAHILDLAGEEELQKEVVSWGDTPGLPIDLKAKVRYLSEHTEAIPRNQEDIAIDIGLACVATRIAVERHAGSIEPLYTPSGTVYVQRGKDLTRVRKVIGTGGIIAYGKDPKWVLESGCFNTQNPTSLKPKEPEFLVDDMYILYAVGLLNKVAPEKALRIAKKYLKRA